MPIIDPLKLLLIYQILIVHVFVIVDDTLHFFSVVKLCLLEFSHQKLVTLSFFEQFDELFLMICFQRLKQLGLFFTIK